MSTQTFTIGWSRSGEVYSKSVAITADGSFDGDPVIALSSTDYEVDIAFLKDNLKSIWILSDKNLTLETNAVDATGGNTISIVANQPFFWYTGCGLSNPFTHDVTVCYFTRTGTDAAVGNATVQIRGQHDITPA